MNLRLLVVVFVCLASLMLPAAATATGVRVDFDEFIADVTSPPNNVSPVAGRSTTIHGVSGTIGRIWVELGSVTHAFPDDLDIMLVAPNGDRLMLMSDAGGGTDITSARLEITSTSQVLPNGGPFPDPAYFAPVNYVNGGGDDVDEAAMGGSGTLYTSFTPFLDRSPNGTWQLIVRDDSGGDGGSIFQAKIGFNVVGAPSNVIDGTTEDTDIYSASGSFPVSWSPGFGHVAVQQYHTCLIAFDAPVLAGGIATCNQATVPGATDFLGLANGPYTRTLTPALPDGRYRSCSYLQDLADHMSAPSCSDGFWVDTVAPGTPGSVGDGASGDVDVAPTRGAVSINWAAATDASSGVASYEWCLNDVASCDTPLRSGSTATAETTASTSATPTLPIGFAIACVRAVDAAGHRSAYTCSDGFAVPKSTVTKLVIAPGSFAAGTKVLAKLPLAKFQLSRTSSINIRAEREVQGYKVGAKCVAKKPVKPAKPARCALYIPVGPAVAATGAVGANSVRMSTRLAASLKPGTWVLAVTASEGSESVTARTKFRVTAKR